MKPETYAHILPKVEGVVHTLGTLLEDGKYKKALREGDFAALLESFFGGGSNPLEKGMGPGSYEVLNRDAGMLFRCAAEVEGSVEFAEQHCASARRFWRVAFQGEYLLPSRLCISRQRMYSAL